VDVISRSFVVRVVSLKYANADEVAFTSSRVAPPGVRIVPYRPTNSVLISGPAPSVGEMVDVIQKP
jgi:type II secretory pathway component GspD/PulD (secretin)